MNIDNEALLSIIERIERINTQIADANDAKKTIMNEAKSRGFIPKAIVHVLKQRKKERAERDEEKDIFDTYETAAGLD